MLRPGKLSFLWVGIMLTEFLFSQTEFRLPASHNFNDIRAAADDYFANRQSAIQQNEEGVYEENDYLRYKRWEWYWSTRVNPDGTFPDLMQQNSVYRSLNSQVPSQSSMQWTNISQTYGDGGYSGMGRATCVAFHPTDSNIFYVGAPIGGIWKTTDGGQTYSALGDGLPYVSAGTIVVDHRNPDNIYITVGDHIGWWNYGLGVYKTTDGGLTWNPTSLVNSFSQGIAYYEMAMSPTSPDTILVARSNGLYRTVDGGVNWQLVHNGGHRAVRFRPGDGNVVYAATDDYWGYSEVYRSLDAGATWTQISSFNQNYNYLRITTSNADPDRLGISCDYSGTRKLYVSTDSGTTIVYRGVIPGTDMVFMSSTDTSVVYCGGVNIEKSTDGGASWNQLSNWYNDGVHPTVHADEHYAAFDPLNGCSYFCNDGGLFRLRESNGTWAELNNGFVTTQFYRIAVSQTDPVFMIGGTQDNGGRKRTAMNVWEATNGGDAMENAIDESNDQTIYTTYVYGLLYRSFDQWTNDVYTDITPPNSTGSWVTPYVLDPNNQAVIVAGYQDVYISPDWGYSWNQISTNLTGASTNTLECIAVSKANSSVIYASRGNTIYSTHDYGANWQSNLTPIGNANFSSITSLAVFPGRNDTVYMTVGGYTATKKVYRSFNGGVSWTNISGSLPNVPVSCGIFNRASFFHDYYIGTDVGVFLINDTMNTWLYYGTGIPNTAITDLEIQYATGKLRAATYGRGIWEIDIDGTTGIAPQHWTDHADDLSLALNPVQDVLLFNAHMNVESDATFFISDISGKLIMQKDQHMPLGNYQIAFDIESLNAGLYFVSVIEGDGAPETFRFVKVK